VSAITVPDFGNILKIGKFYSGVMYLLHTTGDRIPAKIFWLSQAPPLRRTNDAHVEVY
jgi:hypothetical protein